MLADVRDESAEDVRLVLEPKSRNVEPEVLMESLFRQTDLEVRVGLNMNVLDADQHAAGDEPARGAARVPRPPPRGAGPAHPHRLEKIADRLEVLEGYLIAYLNLDEVIRIIREEDEPKAVMMKRFEADRGAGRGDPQHAPARAAQAGGDRDQGRAQGSTPSRRTLKALLKRRSPGSRRRSAKEIARDQARKFGPKTELGRRPHEIGERLNR